MSKADLSFRLLAIIRFTIASNSSRTLNATQAYDVTSSGITLASAIGKLLDKDVAVKAEIPVGEVVNIGLSLTAAGYDARLPTEGTEKQITGSIGNSTATLSVAKKPAKRTPAAESSDMKLDGSRDPPAYNATTLSFTGDASIIPAGGAPKNSKATNPNTTFYGGIPVGTGDYNKWQGKYAVLKINTITGNCVLRIYDA